MTLTPTPRRRAARLAGTSLLAVVGLAAGLGAPAQAAPAPAPTYPSDSVKPDLLPVLSGFTRLWHSNGTNDLHGTVLDAKTLQHNDRLVSWINQNATPAQRFRALQNAAYLAEDGSGYDQSITIADGLGSRLGRLYAQGRMSGKLPLTTALVNSSNGTTGAYLGTGDAKKAFSYPRPFLQVDPAAAPVPGDTPECAPAKVNGSSLAAIRKGTPWADAKGNLRITRLARTVDKTHRSATTDVKLDPEYGGKGICTGGGYPSGHTTTAYQAGITLATLLPEVAPEILTRASEAGNNRIVLGVHYPLDIIGGRMDGEVSLAARWGDKEFRNKVLAPARAELVGYLTKACHTKTIAACAAADTAYTDNPYGGRAIPGGSTQIVTNRASALRVYTERMGYGFAPTSSTKLAASVPGGAENLLLTAFPTLTPAQRRMVLAQTQVASGNPLDTTAAHRAYGRIPGSWQRINLAAAMSAKVVLDRKGIAHVISTAGKPGVVKVR